MIERMKVVHVLARADNKSGLLRGLRELGILHLSEKAPSDDTLLARFEQLSRLSLLLGEYDVKQESELLSDEAFETVYDNLQKATEERKSSETRRGMLFTAMEKLRPWGNFSLSDLNDLREHGLSFSFYRVDRKVLLALQQTEDVSFFTLAPVDGMAAIAVLGVLPPEYSATKFILPENSLEDLEREYQRCEEKITSCNKVIEDSARYLSSFKAQMLKAQNDADYSAVSNTVASSDGLVWLQGYIPEAQVEEFKSAASAGQWAYAIEDPDEDDDKVPTKVKYNKITRLMIPVFDILGTVPGYHEYDISFWFLGFFTLFFAMIIGDAGYGFLFLIGAIALTVKTKKLGNATMLLWVLSIATIVWGSLTGTWFGLEGAMKIPFLKALVIPTFANYPEYFGVSTTVQQNCIMKFCFILGTIQLTLACVMNIRTKLKAKNLSWVSDLGWLCAIDALYFVVLYLVIGEKVTLAPVAAVVIFGFLLVVLFGGMSPDKSFAQGLKAGLGDAFTVFLNTISAFGNIMSYIRLFAVGMASLAIAQSFNNMALGFDGPLIIVGAVIMLIGHVLNIVMGFLSVVVHGVRLNLLEFSGQLGMEWAGIAYDPFKNQDKIKK